MTFARPSRRRQSRIAHLESLLAPCATPEQIPNLQTEEEWLEQFQRWAAEGLYQHESELPILINRLELALQNAKETIEPSFYPPADFMPHLDVPGRLCQWRCESRFPELNHVFMSLLKMSERAIEGKLRSAGWNGMMAL